MDFLQFAESHGVLIPGAPLLHRWVRVPTVDHPRKKNGAYIFDGQSGAVMNWAVHTSPITFRQEGEFKPDPLAAQRREEAAKQLLQRREDAGKKAAWIMSQARPGHHPYLERKGFPGEFGHVWNGLLVIPMRVSGQLVGCQLIDQDGGKKFLSGQVTKGAQAIFDGKGPDLVCEGYATALSVRRVMRLLGRPYRIRVAFSAGNLEVVAKIPCLVIADNDAAGLKAARASQNPFWASDVPGEDFNDVERRLGTEDLAVIFGRCLDAAVSHNLYKPLQKYS